MSVRRLWLPLLLVALVWPVAPVPAADLDGWRLLQLSAGEQRAVFTSPDGRLHLFRPGDRLGEKLVLNGFDGDRAVLEKRGEWGRVTFFVGLADGRQVVASRERQPLRKPEFSGESTEIRSAPGVLVRKGL